MKQQTFNDGILDIYSVGNVAIAGNMPIEGLTIKVGPLRYEDRIVGMSRFWTAAQSAVKIDKLVRVPRFESISSQDIVVIDKDRFEIKQIQAVMDVIPDCMDISLERLEVDHELN